MCVFVVVVWFGLIVGFCFVLQIISLLLLL